MNKDIELDKKFFEITNVANHNAGVQGGQRASEDPLAIQSTLLDSIALSRHICDRSFLTIQCLYCGYRHKVLAGSRDRTCPECSKELYYRLYEKYEPVVANSRNLKLLTLTTKPVEYQTASYVREMGKYLNKFLHLKRYRRLWRGLLAVVECKETPYGWFYYHIHVLLDGIYVPQSLISVDWRRISGFPIVWINKVNRTPKKALFYVLKYVLKGFNFENPRAKDDFKASMKGVRYVRSYGSFYNFNYRASKHVYFPCPSCGEVKSWVLLEFVDSVTLFAGVPYG